MTTPQALRRDGHAPRGLAGLLPPLPFPGEDLESRLFLGTHARGVRSHADSSAESWQRLVPRARRGVDYTGAPSADELIEGRWRDHAACAGCDTDSWFPDQGGNVPNTAHRICSRCPVQRECLAWALAFTEPHGTWGGLSVAARRPLAKRVDHGEPLGRVFDDALGSHETDQGEAA